MKILVDKNNKVTNTYNGNEGKQGWIEIDSIPEPKQKEGYVPVPYYRDGKIVYEYEAIPEMPEEEEIPIPVVSYEQQVQNKIHERYSLDDEIAIVRKEIAKMGNTSEEFNRYNQYAEDCKAQIKSTLINKDN